MADSGTSIAEQIKAYLGMENNPVGVKICVEDVPEGKRPAEKMTFCQVVAAALKGEELVLTPDELNCTSAELALGFREPKYANVEPRIKRNVKAVLVGPIEGADVVLFVLDSRQTMTMAILFGGLKAEFKGEMAFCGEAVAKVFESGEANVSFLCNGSRNNAGYTESQVVLGLPYERFLELPQKMGKFSSLGRGLKAGASLFLRRL